MILERLTITFDEAGVIVSTFAQGHGGLRVPLHLTELTSAIPALNVAALDRVTDLEAELAAVNADYVVATTALGEIETLATAGLTKNPTIALTDIAAKAIAGRRKAVEQEIVELETQAVEITARVETLRSNLDKASSPR